MRLFQLYLRKECTYIIKNLPKSAAPELTYNQLPKHPIIEADAAASYKDDMLYLILYAVFVEGKTIRAQQAFEQSLKQHKGELVGFANEAGKIVLEIMELYGAIKAQLKRFNANDPMVQDVNEQLKFMVYAGFIRHTPFQQLKAMPRYLKAILYRIDKLDNSPQKIQEINRYWTRYWKDVEKQAKKEPIIPEQDNYRWMLEEFRVSLFAQQLKTAYPVSAKRMEKAWDERG
jgi:ATP-dependent helicase HrpA